MEQMGIGRDGTTQLQVHCLIILSSGHGGPSHRSRALLDPSTIKPLRAPKSKALFNGSHIKMMATSARTLAARGAGGSSPTMKPQVRGL